jgi:Ca2+-transporting ATPase
LAGVNPDLESHVSMPARLIPADRLPRNLTPDQGLTAAEVAERRGRFGANDIVTAAPAGWRDLLKDTLRDPMIWFLVAVSALFTGLGQLTEAAILALALVPLLGMDAYLHRRTQASTQGLASRLAATACLWRDGIRVTLPAREVVPGDLVAVAPGEGFPADGLIVAGADLQVDESSLTGEAYPVRKQPVAVLPDLPHRAEASAWGFAGTRLLTGEARMLVTQTGGETRYGEIVRSALLGSHGRTPLQVAVTRLVGILLAAALIGCLGLAAIRLIQGHGLLDAFVSAATLGVAAMPEEFPVVLTFFLGVGVYRLARRQALVRRAVAVENIGRVTCICSDKTGTLTEGKLVLSHVIPSGAATADQVTAWAAMAARGESGDPLDVALLAAAPSTAGVTRIRVFPFTEDRRRETAIVRLADGSCLALVKGAPETVFNLCQDSAAVIAAARAEMTRYASEGHKVIAVASQVLDGSALPEQEPTGTYCLAGLLALEDPVRAGVAAAVAACRQAGIRVIMVTGDHPATATAIGGEIGLGAGKPVVVLADDLAVAARGQQGAATTVDLAKVDVVARAAPGQKLALVAALQLAGEIVAVTGDGVNDVPALQKADIGIAMGERGTQSAREVAAIVLLDDNFRTIVRAIAEGRQLFRNLQLAFVYLLLIHIPLVLSAAAIPLADHPLLYLPVHIVWLELIIHPTILLVFQELPTTDQLLPAEKTGAAHFFSRSSWLAIGFAGLLLALILSLLFEYALGPDNAVEHARSLALGALITASAAITLTLTGLRNGAAWITASGSLASLGLLVQVPMLARLMHLDPLHTGDWGLVLAIGLVAAGLALAVKHSMAMGATQSVPPVA